MVQTVKRSSLFVYRWRATQIGSITETSSFRWNLDGEFFHYFYVSVPSPRIRSKIRYFYYNLVSQLLNSLFRCSTLYANYYHMLFSCEFVSMLVFHRADLHQHKSTAFFLYTATCHLVVVYTEHYYISTADTKTTITMMTYGNCLRLSVCSIINDVFTFNWRDMIILRRVYFV